MCVWRKPSFVNINLSFHALVPCPDPKPPDIIITRYIQHLVAKTKKMRIFTLIFEVRLIGVDTTCGLILHMCVTA